MIENLLNSSQLTELFNALAENGEYNFSEKGLNISAKSSDGAFQISVNYQEPENKAKKEAEDFNKYVNSIEDELFVEVCESLGNQTVMKINDCLKSNDVEKVRYAILVFKQEFKKLLLSKVEKYNKYLTQL